jgi:hypothetical protein
MAQLYRSVAALRISGEELDPAEITDLLGCAPTAGQRKGDVLTGSVTGRSRIAKFGMWSLEASDQEPGSLDAQITELLGRLTPSLEVWSSISRRYDMDLFCGFFMRATNEGLEISAESLAALGRRGIALGLDIYARTLEDMERTSDA